MRPALGAIGLWWNGFKRSDWSYFKFHLGWDLKAEKAEAFMIHESFGLV